MQRMMARETAKHLDIDHREVLVFSTWNYRKALAHRESS
jgi:hypothetical protein